MNFYDLVSGKIPVYIKDTGIQVYIIHVSAGLDKNGESEYDIQIQFPWNKEVQTQLNILRKKLGAITVLHGLASAKVGLKVLTEVPFGTELGYILYED